MLQMKLIMMVLLSDPAPSDWLGQCGQSKKKKSSQTLNGKRRVAALRLETFAHRPTWWDPGCDGYHSIVAWTIAV